MFQSAPPVRAATVNLDILCGWIGVSIRAAREGGDENAAIVQIGIKSFNPRRP